MTPLPVQSVRLKDFRGIPDLEVDLVHPESSLKGHWTCVVGVNGAGKTAILQGIALALLGPYATELGAERLKRMRRSGCGSATVTVMAGDFEIQASLGDRGAEWPVGEKPRADQERWRQIDEMIVLGYGASRNLSEFDSPRHRAELSTELRRVLSLFDPLTQLASATSQLQGSKPNAGWVLLARLLERLPLQLQLVNPDGTRWLDAQRAGEALWIRTSDGVFGPSDLPDGYRATLAWLADLCLQHGGLYPQCTSLEEIQALVLVDEVDLHLHPRLQRELVPALREALPKVQWVVTTHSPLVLACFDRHEIVALDREAEGGVQRLDRQILGFSADEIYRWLMDTEPHTSVLSGLSIEQQEKALTASPEVDDQQAAQIAEGRRQWLASLLP